MSFYIPNIKELEETFPEFKEFEYLNKGGFKAVFKVNIKGNFEALKLAYIPVIDSSDPVIKEERLQEATNRIIREISILERSDCPYIVKLGVLKPTYVSINKNNYVVYTEEFIEGNNLEQLITEKYMPDDNELRILAKCMFESIRFIWEELKIVHRDIKPLNIIKTVLPERPFVLLDYGIAYAINETPLTKDASQRFPPGTFINIAPEMFQKGFRETIDYRSDLYNVGLTLYEYASGVHPFIKREGEQLSTIYNIVNSTPKPIEEVRTDLSEDLVEIINQLLKKIPALRPGNFKNLIKKMEGVK